MRIWIFLLCMLSVIPAYSQRRFYRIYNRNNDKIAAGFITAVRDSSLVLRTPEGQRKISVEKIGKLKSGHSSAPNIVGGMLVGGITGAAVGAKKDPAPSSTYTGTMINQSERGGSAAAGFFLGMIAGAAIGGLSVAFKNVTIYEINGNIQSLHNAFPEL